MKTLLRDLAKRVYYFGSERHCPVCNTPLRRFRPFGKNPQARCPFCRSLERDRATWLYLKRETDFWEPKPKKMLHVAPEASLSPRFASHSHIDYLTADFERDDVMVKMDLTEIQYPDDSFDVIYCAHVLEHIPSDRQAMRELARVLRPAGWAVLLVPIKGETTYEDLSVTDPNERRRLFGQWNHVRQYGADFPQRLEAEGFQVESISTKAYFSESEYYRYGLIDETIYVCRLRSQAPPTDESIAAAGEKRSETVVG